MTRDEYHATRTNSDELRSDTDRQMHQMCDYSNHLGSSLNCSKKMKDQPIVLKSLREDSSSLKKEPLKRPINTNIFGSMTTWNLKKLYN